MASVRRFEDLVVWQLAEQVREEVFRLTSPDRVRQDRDFCDDIHRSARSAPANIAEGFGYYEPKQNAKYVRIARGSLEETKNHTMDGFKRHHFDAADHDALLTLIRRALGATTRYLAYLRSCKNPPPGKSFEPAHERGTNHEPGTRNPPGTRNQEPTWNPEPGTRPGTLNREPDREP